MKELKIDLSLLSLTLTEMFVLFCETPVTRISIWLEREYLMITLPVQVWWMSSCYIYTT